MLALLVAGAFLLARVVRLGWIADYFSRAVLIGYIHGVAVVLVCGQLGKLLGLDVDAQDPLPQLVEVTRELPGLSGATVTVGATCLALLLVLRWQMPKLPGPLAGGGRGGGHWLAALRGRQERDPAGQPGRAVSSDLVSAVGSWLSRG
jgi:SulP family sulfate permease